MREINLIGQKFGRLIVREMLAKSRCACDCDCGKAGHVTARYSVLHGLSRSCGCGKPKQAHLKHGESCKGQWSPEYRAWVNMITRCHNPNATRFKDWGGRGIRVCDEWRANYEAFLAYVGRRPSSQHSLDRFPDVNGNYEPGNVRWATRSEQARNTRRSRNA